MGGWLLHQFLTYASKEDTSATVVIHAIQLAISRDAIWFWETAQNALLVTQCWPQCFLIALGGD